MSDARHDASADAPDESRQQVALACRALVHAGVLNGTLGHVSVRAGEGRAWVRCRGPEERGLRFTSAGDVHAVGLDGTPPDDDRYRAPHELPIHTAVMRRRPEVNAVVHAHPNFALLVGLADLSLEPLFGAYNIPAMQLAADGVAVYPRAVLINDDRLAAEFVTSLGDSQVALLRGHGIVTTGASLEAAVIAAVNLEELCRVTVELHRLGVRPAAINAEDRTQLPDLGRRFNDAQAYRNLVAEVLAAELESGRAR